jgi:hypothetical protein
MAKAELVERIKALQRSDPQAKQVRKGKLTGE